MNIDLEKNEGVLFEFEFASIEDPCENMRYHVYSFNREMIKLFAKQHGFNPDDMCINIHSDINHEDDEKMNDNLLLKVYRFKSNFSNQEYRIISCQRFIDKAIEDAGQDITARLWFDTIIMRHDIEFIKLINRLVKKLSHVFIMDNLLVDDLWNEENDNKETFHKSYNIPGYDDYWIEGCSNYSEYVVDSLFDSSIENEVQPITIESYVKSFTEMITDVYTEQQYDLSEPF